MKRACTYLLTSTGLVLILMLMAYPRVPANLEHVKAPVITDQGELLKKLQGSLSQVELLYYLLHQNKVEEPAMSSLGNGDVLYEFPRLGWKVTKFADKKILPVAQRLS